jgi:DNA polymerase I
VPQLLEKINNLVITISGSCFAKHNDQLGLFVNFLTEMGRLRSQYRKLAAEFPRGSEQHAFYHSRQLAIKVLSNSAYGVLGLKSFRYSNNHLAQSITASGKLTIKLAQHLTDKYLMEFES